MIDSERSGRESATAIRLGFGDFMILLWYPDAVDGHGEKLLRLCPRNPAFADRHESQ
jgi:hypothetical protein